MSPLGKLFERLDAECDLLCQPGICHCPDKSMVQQGEVPCSVDQVLYASQAIGQEPDQENGSATPGKKESSRIERAPHSSAAAHLPSLGPGNEILESMI